MRLFILLLSATCVISYGYALAGYGGTFFDRGRPDYVAGGLAAGTACGAAALYSWKKWLRDTQPDMLIFDVDGVLIEEGPSISRSWKELGLPVGIYTGRTRDDMAGVYQALSWQDFPDDMLICVSDGILKPSPEGLTILCRRGGARHPIYFGDMSVDLAAWKSFGKGMFVGIGPLLKPLAQRGDFLHFDTLEEALLVLI